MYNLIQYASGPIKIYNLPIHLYYSLCEYIFTHSSVGLLSEEQCKARDVRRKARAPIKKEPVPEKVTKATADSSECEEFLPENPLEHLADEYRQLLERVVTYQDEYDVPSEDDLLQITVSIRSRGGGVGRVCFFILCASLD